MVLIGERHPPGSNPWMQDCLELPPLRLVCEDYFPNEEPVRLSPWPDHVRSEHALNLVANLRIVVEEFPRALVCIKTNAGQLLAQCPAEC